MHGCLTSSCRRIVLPIAGLVPSDADSPAAAQAASDSKQRALDAAVAATKTGLLRDLWRHLYKLSTDLQIISKIREDAMQQMQDPRGDRQSKTQVGRNRLLCHSTAGSGIAAACQDS
jgi:hypothetical protein